MAKSDLEMIQLAAAKQGGFFSCRSKLAEVTEKMLKAELIRLGWPLERTHDLERLLDELVLRNSDVVSDFEPLCDALADAYFSDRYPGFDLDDPDWEMLAVQIGQAFELLQKLERRIPTRPGD